MDKFPLRQLDNSFLMFYIVFEVIERIFKMYLSILLLIIFPYILLNAQTTDTAKFQNPHTLFRLTFNNLNRLPVRGIENYLPLFPGVIEINGSLHLVQSTDGLPAVLFTAECEQEEN